MTKLEPIHPGKTMKCDFMDPLSLSAETQSNEIGVPSERIEEIARGNRPISNDPARRFSEYFNTDAQFWINLQKPCDREISEWKKLRASSFISSQNAAFSSLPIGNISQFCSIDPIFALSALRPDHPDSECREGAEKVDKTSLRTTRPYGIVVC